ncbi:MAG: exodeoxyribonuclease VII small subunit [Prochlorococcus sp.]|jgi:exodeoxyribonuclease VII small subunit
MKKSSSSENVSKGSGPRGQRHAINTAKATMANMQEQWRQDSKSLSYEESLQALDLLLVQLQNENVPVEELQGSYLHGKIYLEHCEALLNSVEQNVLQLDADSLSQDPDL